MATTADIIITNGRVVTMDDAHPFAEGLAISGNTITAVGSRADVLGLKGPGTKVFDAQGATVMPGLIESHVHIFIGSAELDSLDVTNFHSNDQLARAARNYAAKRPDDRLLYGCGAGYHLDQPGVTTSRHDLDRVMPERPFAMMTADHHTVFANTLALKAAGIFGGGDTPGAEIVMAADGTPTGELREPAAFKAVLALTPTGGRDALGYTDAAEPDPAPTAAQRAADRAVLKKGLDTCAAYGFTTVHNMDGNYYQLELLQEIDDAGDFSCRCQSPFHLKPYFPLADLEKASDMHRRFRSERVYSGRVKLFMDGVTDSYTAYYVDDYLDRPGFHGEALFGADEFNAAAIEIEKRGLQINVHCVGDAAVRRTLDGCAAARKVHGPRDTRHRIEHIELVHPDDIPRFKELGVIASMQTLHAPGIQFPVDSFLGHIPAKSLPYAFAWNEMRAVSPVMPFASDWPVSPLDPMLSFYAGMARQPLVPGLPDQRQTLMQCIAGYTRDGAYAEFAESRKGKLKPGMLADVCVMNRNLEASSVDEIKGARALLTICDGRVTHGAV